MVAVTSSTVAKGGVRMLAWALWALLLLQSLAHAHSRPSEKYGDVSNEEVVIDHLEDLLRSHSGFPEDAALRFNAPTRGDQRHKQQKHLVPNLHEKIKFGVGPKDPRFYLPPNRAANLPEEEEVYQPFPGDLPILSSHPGYREEVLPFPEEDVDDQYAPQYQQELDGYGPQYPMEYPGVGIPVDAMAAASLARRIEEMRELRGGARRMGLQEEEEGNGGREEEKRLMEAATDEGQGMARMGEKDEKKKAGVKPATSQPEEVHYLNRSPNHVQQGEPRFEHHKEPHKGSLEGVYFVAIVAGCTAVAVFGVISAGICWYRLNKNHRAAQVADYPAYGVTGPNKDLSPSSGDRKLAQSAHMYHYQHQKQQMIALEKSSGGERHGSTSDVDSEEEGEENEYTVYECPGLAPTGEMEVKNPLFHDDPTPATPSMRKEADDEEEEDEEPKAK